MLLKRDDMKPSILVSDMLIGIKDQSIFTMFFINFKQDLWFSSLCQLTLFTQLSRPPAHCGSSAIFFCQIVQKVVTKNLGTVLNPQKAVV
jgi:hypothetical protein